MSTKQVGGVLNHFRRFMLDMWSGMSDRELLDAFIARRDESLFEALVQRHGRMVWGVCRRLLHNHEDAEDAFQAVFLVLLRKAETIVSREIVGSWLYSVAHQTARTPGPWRPNVNSGTPRARAARAG